MKEKKKKKLYEKNISSCWWNDNITNRMLDCLKRKEEGKRLYRNSIRPMKTKLRTDEFAFTKINTYDDNIYISVHYNKHSILIVGVI